MTLVYLPTFSWQSFSLTGLPSRLKNYNDKNLTLAKAVEVWNLSVKSRGDCLQIAAVSQSIRKLLDAAKEAKQRAVRAQPLPNF